VSWSRSCDKAEVKKTSNTEAKAKTSNLKIKAKAPKSKTRAVKICLGSLEAMHCLEAPRHCQLGVSEFKCHAG